MVLLHWAFINGHAWSKSFETVEHAEQHVLTCGFYLNWAIDRVWIDGPNGQTWLKEKTND